MAPVILAVGTRKDQWSASGCRTASGDDGMEKMPQPHSHYERLNIRIDASAGNKKKTFPRLVNVFSELSCLAYRNKTVAFQILITEDL
jgi:hypothetical protein